MGHYPLYKQTKKLIFATAFFLLLAAVVSAYDNTSLNGIYAYQINTQTGYVAEGKIRFDGDGTGLYGSSDRFTYSVGLDGQITIHLPLHTLEGYVSASGGILVAIEGGDTTWNMVRLVDFGQAFSALNGRFHAQEYNAGAFNEITMIWTVTDQYGHMGPREVTLKINEVSFDGEPVEEITATTNTEDAQYAIGTGEEIILVTEMASGYAYGQNSFIGIKNGSNVSRTSLLGLYRTTILKPLGIEPSNILFDGNGKGTDPKGDQITYTVDSDGGLNLFYADGTNVTGAVSESGEFAFWFDPNTDYTYRAVRVESNKPMITSPTGTTSDTTPNLAWSVHSMATWYKVYLVEQSGSRTYKYARWFETEDNTKDFDEAACTDGQCSVTIDQKMPEGTYDAWVMGFNTDGYSQWSEKSSFTVSTSDLKPEIITVISPAGIIYDTTPTISWTEDTKSDWYKLYISGPNGYKFSQWYELYNHSPCYPDAVCVDGTCSVTLDKTLENGTYSAWVKGWNEFGNGEWSDSEIKFGVNYYTADPEY
ncbi:MAG: hypothetical protein GY729_10220 [Desulfobacteraceae bacterium]|nr:hypothetical protein [Desulfobacteraceae bacterium]